MRLPTSDDVNDWASTSVIVGLAVVVWGIASVFFAGAAAIIIWSVR